MQVEVSWLAVLLATLSSMVVGALWYAPFVFGKQWQKLAKVSDTKKNETGWSAIAIAVVVSLITAYVLAAAAYLTSAFYSGSFFTSSLLAGFYLWLGIAATALVTHDTFERRHPKLTLIKLASHLVTLLTMSAVIGVVGL